MPFLAWLLVTQPLPLRHLSPSECIPLNSSGTGYRSHQFAVNHPFPSFPPLPSPYTLPLAFHGTPIANLHSILRHSLRGSPSIWMAEDLEVSVSYMREARRVTWSGSRLSEGGGGVRCCLLLEVMDIPARSVTGWSTWTTVGSTIRLVGVIVISAGVEPLGVRASDHRAKVDGWRNIKQDHQLAH